MTRLRCWGIRGNTRISRNNTKHPPKHEKESDFRSSVYTQFLLTTTCVISSPTYSSRRAQQDTHSARLNQVLMHPHKLLYTVSIEPNPDPLPRIYDKLQPLHFRFLVPSLLYAQANKHCCAQPRRHCLPIAATPHERKALLMCTKNLEDIPRRLRARSCSDNIARIRRMPHGTPCKPHLQQSHQQIHPYPRLHQSRR